MRHRLVLAALVPVVVALGGTSSASAAPSSGASSTNHGQCVSQSAQAGSQGGRSATARDKNSCPVPLVCFENQDGKGTVIRNRADDEVTVIGSGAGSLGSSLECRTDIAVETGDTVSFSYELGDDTAACGGGVPRMFIMFADGSIEQTVDSDPECKLQDEGTFTYSIKGTGTVVRVGFVYDRGDTGSVTYSDTVVGGVPLNI